MYSVAFSRFIESKIMSFRFLRFRLIEQLYLVVIALSMIACLVFSALPVQAQKFTPVNIYVPKFQSPQGKSSIGGRTALILGLQIWRTYSIETKSPYLFDNANIAYSLKFAPADYAEMEALAKSLYKKPDLVLWGRASQYGNGIVVESNLWLPAGLTKKDRGANIWSITIPTGGKSQTISVDVPSRHYEFAPIVLDPAIINTHNPDSTYINIYQLRSTAAVTIADLTSTNIQAKRHVGDWSEVILTDTHQSGWIYLPKISENPSEVVNFCGAIIRFLRNDWAGSIKLFEDVLTNSKIPTDVKIDSYLYMSMAYDRMGDEAKSLSMVTKAYNLNPYSRVTTQYLLMTYLTRLARVFRIDPNAEQAKKIISSLQDVIARNRVLFADNDRWITQAEKIIDQLNI